MAKILLRGLGISLLVLLAYGVYEYWQHRNERETFVGGLSQPIMVLELARKVAEIEPVKVHLAKTISAENRKACLLSKEKLELSEQEKLWRCSLTQSIWGDSAIIIPVYGVLLLLFAALLLLHKFRYSGLLGWLAILFTLGAVGFDYAENAGLTQTLLNQSGALTNDALSRIWWPSQVKWSLLFLTFACLSAIFLKPAKQSDGAGRFYSIIKFSIGVLLLAEAMIGLFGMSLYCLSGTPSVWVERAFLPGLLALALIGVLFAVWPKRFLMGLSASDTFDKAGDLPVPLFRVLIEEHKVHEEQGSVTAPIDVNEDDYKELEQQYDHSKSKSKREQLLEEMRKLDEKLVAKFYSQIHQNAKMGRKRYAICFSGGGVRSATFALGLLQGLIKQKVNLGNFHYLSTVSGGGYTGSWLSAWMHHDGLEQVEKALGKPQNSGKSEPKDPINPEPEELQHLRRYSNPLTPNLGITSADTWTLVGTYLRNLSLNWMVLMPLLMFFLTVPRLAMAFACWDKPPEWLLTKLPLVGLFLGCFSIHYFVTHRPSLKKLRHPLPWFKGELRQDEIGFLLWCLLPLMIEAAIFTSFWAWAPILYKPAALVRLFTNWWLGLLAICGLLAFVRLCWIGNNQSKRWPKSKLPFVLAGLAVVTSVLGWWKFPTGTNYEVFSLATPSIFIFFACAQYAGGLFLSWFLTGRWDRRELIFSLVLTGLIGGLALWAGGLLNPQPVNIDVVRELRQDSPQLSPTATPTPQPDKQLIKLSGEPLTLTLETDARKQTALKLETPIITETQKGLDNATRRAAESVSSIKRTGWYIVFGAPMFFLAFLIAATLFIGLSSGITTDADREWMARAGAWILMAGIGWIVTSTTVLFGPEWLLRANSYIVAAITTGSGLTTLILGWLPKTAANSKSSGQESRLLKLGLPLVALIFALSLFALLALATDGLLLGLVKLTEFWPFTWVYTNLFPGSARPLSFLDSAVRQAADANFIKWHWILLQELSGPIVSVGAVLLLSVGAVLGVFVNVNKFSLHAANRDRLIRAYMGASNKQRRANPFTGFDLRDDLQIHELLEPLFDKESFVDDRFDQFVAWLKPRPEGGWVEEKARFIWREFDESTHQQLEMYSSDKRTELKPLLARELNRLIHGELLAPLPQPSQGWFQRLIAKAFYMPKHAEGIFTEQDVLEILDRLAPEQRKGVIQDVPVFPGLMGKLALPRVVTTRRLWLNRRLLEEACKDSSGNDQSGGDQPKRETAAASASGGEACQKPKPNEFLLKCDYKFQKEARPFHVVNMTLNLVNSKELAWQERKARSFFATPLHVGAPLIGLRRAAEYATTFDGKGALTLGTAMAISGAAANPNAGYNSSPMISFFLTLFNVRLGWWLGNPGLAGQNTYRASSPAFAPNMLLAETFGLTDDEHAYVNVSDGGHFDNLGLYEMVRRRCHFIIVSDGGQDDKYNYDDLGIAIRYIRADLGVPIVFKTPLPSGSHNGDKEKRVAANQEHYAIAEIQYEAVDGEEAEPGVLILVKPAVYGKEPADIYNYALSNPAFPHDPTFTDQFFSESQFESYRHLGEYTVEQIAGGLRANPKEGLAECLEKASPIAKAPAKTTPGNQTKKLWI